MADFGLGNFSDTDDDAAVDELISQTKDLCVLEQVSKINCSSFNDSLLPSDLETRFRKLKSFPASSTRTAAAAAPKSLSNSKSELHRRAERGFEDGRVNPSDGQAPKTTTASATVAAKASSPLNSSAAEEGFSEKPMAAKGFGKESNRGSVSSSRSDSSNSSCIEDVIYSQSEEKAPPSRKSSNPNSKSKGFIGSPLGLLSNCSRDSDSPSPPRKPGCFWCSPQKKTTARKKKSKENWDLDWGSHVGGGDVDDELLSDLGVFSVKEQQKILNKALKEEERINKEAEKIVKWAKQASARMTYHGTEDDDDDDDVTSK